MYIVLPLTEIDMNVLLLATLMSLPIYPLNPVDEDTLAAFNLNLSAGVAGSNELFDIGPVFVWKNEWLIDHPIVIRTSAEYRFGDVAFTTIPRGTANQLTLAAETFYYRGTDRMTGYVGIGLVYSMNSYSPNRSATDSLKLIENIDDVNLEDQFGYRLNFGLRFHRVYSLELSITEVRSHLVYYTKNSASSFQTFNKQIRLGDARLTVGWLLPLK